MIRVNHVLVIMAIAGAGCWQVLAADLVPPAGSVAATGQVVVNDEPDATAPVLRDPFLPVGYVRKSPKGSVPTVKAASGGPVLPPSVAPGVADWSGARKKLKISGTSRYHDKMSGQMKFNAVVNNKFLNEGDTIDIVHEGMIYRFVVGRGADKSFEMNRVNVRPR